MALNVEKTNIIHFRLGTKNRDPLKVKCHGVDVPQVQRVKYLGFIVDESLSWDAHIDLTCGRLSAACFALSRLCGSLHQANIKKAYFGYFHSIMSYGIEHWGLAAERDRAFRAQKRAVRIMCGVEWDHPARELFKEQKILTLPCQFILQAAKYIKTNLEQFPTWADSHNHHTRGKRRIKLPHVRLTKSQKQLPYIGVKIYNTLPESVVDAPSHRSFLRKLKMLLLNKAYYSVEEYLTDKSIYDPY